MALDLVSTLLQASLGLVAALLMVMAARVPARRVFGARIACLLWWLVPCTLAAMALPAPADDLLAGALQKAATGSGAGIQVGLARVLPTGTASGWLPEAAAALLLAAWGAGTLLHAGATWAAQRRVHRMLGPLERGAGGVYVTRSRAVGPLVIGVLRPRIVLPADFASRWAPAEAALVLAHERAHLRRGDVFASLVAEVLRCVHWFNPLVHIAVRLFRADQEFACDASVLARKTCSRRTYADAMLKTQLAVPGLPVGCQWQSSHVLKERILMLKARQPGRLRRTGGTIAVAMLVAGTGFGAWAMQPSDIHDAPAPHASPTSRASTRPAAESESRAPGALTPTAVAGKRPVVAVVPPAGGPGKAAASPHTPAPVYPPAALAAGQGGRVLMHVLVGTDGRVRDVRVVESAPAGVFDAASIEAARTWTLLPERRSGHLVESWQQVPVDFRPDGAPPAPPAPPALPAPPAVAVPPVPPPPPAAPPGAMWMAPFPPPVRPVAVTAP